VERDHGIYTNNAANKASSPASLKPPESESVMFMIAEVASSSLFTPRRSEGSLIDAVCLVGGEGGVDVTVGDRGMISCARRTSRKGGIRSSSW
jgi:hypothetical protein